MTTKFFAAFVAAIMTISTVSAADVNNTKKGETDPDNVLPGVTVVATGSQKIVEAFNGDRKMKYEFNLDAQGRVATKVSYVMNYCDKWAPIAAYSVFYGETETVLTYAEYDHSRKTFTRNPKQVRYNAADYPVIIRVPGM